MPPNFLSEFTVIYVVRGDKQAPPYVTLTTNRGQAEREALEWAQQTFGDGDYTVAGGRFVGLMAGNSWGKCPAPEAGAAAYAKGAALQRRPSRI